MLIQNLKSNDFEQAIQYVLNHGVSKEELFTQFDDEIEYEENSTKWNEEYYAYARVYLKDNFCEKRIKHVEAIAHQIISTSKKKSDGEKNILSNAAKNSGVSSSKKCQGQQTPVVPNSVPIVAKVLSVIAVIVLLAFIIAGVMHQK